MSEKIQSRETIEHYENLKFDNLYNELEFYKSKCDVMEKDLFKTSTKVKKLEAQLKKSQEINTLNAKNVNNTSLQFFLPSEFKNNWENFLKNQIMEAFENIYDSYFWLTHVLQDTMKVTYEETNNLIKEKISQVLGTLNIVETNIESKFLPRFMSIFQEYFTSIFIFSEEFLQKIRQKIITQIIPKYENLDESTKSNIEADLETKSYSNMISTLFKLSIYMLLHDPQLNLNILPYEKRELKYQFYVKNDHINIEGFGNDQTPCIIVLSPPMLRNSFPYQGIKAAVYMIQNPTDEIRKTCEKNQSLNKRSHSNDYSGYNSSSKSEKVELQDNSIHSGRNSSNIQSKTPEPFKNEALNEVSPRNLENIKGKDAIKNNTHAQKTLPNNKNISYNNLKLNTVNSSNIQNSNQYSVYQIINENKKNNSKNNYEISLNNNDDFSNQQNENKQQCFDHPLSMNRAKKSNDPKINLISNHIGSSNKEKNIFIGSHFEQQQFESKVIRNNTKNIKNGSRNSSVKENSNNSISRDSFKPQIDKCDANCTHCLNHNLSTLNAQFHKSSRTKIFNQNMNKEFVSTGNSEKKLDFDGSQENLGRKKNQTNSGKINYIDNNETDPGKNEHSFKAYESNKSNYPLKIDSGFFFNNNYINQIQSDNNTKKDKDGASIKSNNTSNTVTPNKNNSSEKSIFKHEKNHNSMLSDDINIKKIMSNNDTLSNNMTLAKEITTKYKKNEKSPQLNTNHQNQNSHNLPYHQTGTSLLTNLNKNRADSTIKSSVKHVLEYVNKGLSNSGNNTNPSNVVLVTGASQNSKNIKLTKNETNSNYGSNQGPNVTINRETPHQNNFGSQIKAGQETKNNINQRNIEYNLGNNDSSHQNSGSASNRFGSSLISTNIISNHNFNNFIENSKKEYLKASTLNTNIITNQSLRKGAEKRTNSKDSKDLNRENKIEKYISKNSGETKKTQESKSNNGNTMNVNSQNHGLKSNNKYQKINNQNVLNK